MIHVERTVDTELVRSIVAHPKVYPYVSDDSCPPPEQYKPDALVLHPTTYCLLAKYEDALIGLWIFHQHNGVTWEVHTCPNPHMLGDGNMRAGANACVRWMFEHTPCRKIITHVPVNNRLAYKLAMDCGLEDEGLNRKSWLKQGQLVDQHVLGICKE